MTNIQWIRGISLVCTYVAKLWPTDVKYLMKILETSRGSFVVLLSFRCSSEDKNLDFCGLSLVLTSTDYVIALKKWGKEWVSCCRVESSGTLDSSDIFGTADQPAHEATIFHVVRAFAARSRLKGMTLKHLIKYSKHWRQTMSPEECSVFSNMAAKL